jgi:glycosyltransferase involved in cell wall biosynthesis/uncharacterized Fe-S cluster-containing radical SAM superfamily protein
MSSRGCPYDCIYCSSRLLWKNKLRFHSPERVLEELRQLSDQYKLEAVFFEDDLFIADKERVKKICLGLINSGYHRKIIWAVQLKSNLIGSGDMDLLKLMKEAGCVQVEFGFESGSERFLKIIKNNTATVSQNQEALDIAKKAGLRVFGNFIFGFEGETRIDMEKTKEFILKNYRSLDYFQAYIATPYPGTFFWQQCIDSGIIKKAKWERFAMGIAKTDVFSKTVSKSCVESMVSGLTYLSFKKISFKDKLLWLTTRFRDDPGYVVTMILQNIGRRIFFMRSFGEDPKACSLTAKKKVAVLIGQFAQMGGVGVAAIEEVKNLKKLGFDAELLVLMENNKFIHEDFTRDVPVRWLSREYPFFFKFNFKILFFSFFSLFHLLSPFAALFSLKKREYDYIIAHETYNCFTALSLSKFKKIPYIAFIWDPISYILPRVYSNKPLSIFFPFLKPLAAFLDNKILLNSKKTVVCSKMHLGLLSSITNEESKIETVYPGNYPLEGIPEKRGDFILALTKWDLGKNPEFLLFVLKKMRHKDVKLVMAGNWVQKDVYSDFLDRARQLGLSGRIEICGRADNELKNKLFSEALVLVHPIVEAFGMMCLEAAGSGCPFIIPQGSGVTELFQDSVSAFFPKEGDSDAYAACIDRLTSDERLAYEMGKKAWETARKYTWADHTQRLINIANGQ